MKLEVGMYVRTINGIQKFIKETSDVYAFDKGVIIKPDNIEKYIIKASHNIIDLIEVGDYVNGYQVIEEPYNYHDIKFISVDTQDSWSWGKGEMPSTEIKTILTKEQFENNCYKIGD